MPYFPSKDVSERVKRCVRCGMNNTERIAKVVGITEKQLKDNYSYELGFSDDADNMVVAEIAYEMAVSGRFPMMTQWWLERRGGPAWARKDGDDDVNDKSPLIILLPEGAEDGKN